MYSEGYLFHKSGISPQKVTSSTKVEFFYKRLLLPQKWNFSTNG